MEEGGEQEAASIEAGPQLCRAVWGPGAGWAPRKAPTGLLGSWERTRRPGSDAGSNQQQAHAPIPRGRGSHPTWQGLEMAVVAFPGFSGEPHGCSHTHMHTLVRTHVCTRTHTCAHTLQCRPPLQSCRVPSLLTGAPPLDCVTGRDAPGKNRRRLPPHRHRLGRHSLLSFPATNLVPVTAPWLPASRPPAPALPDWKALLSSIPSAPESGGPPSGTRPCLSLGLLGDCAPCPSGVYAPGLD